MKKKWSEDFPAVQFRVARPTDKFEEVIGFYRDGLGLKVVGFFENHDGYDGIMFGLPGVDYHLEFTRHESGSPGMAPSEDNLLVFYMPDKQQRDNIAKRLENMGFPPVPPENPYWEEKGITIEDPDGWRIVLMNSSGLEEKTEDKTEEKTEDNTDEKD